MNEQLSKTEIGKDALQESVEALATTVGEVAAIITTAVKDVASSIGDLATEVFEIGDNARRAARAGTDISSVPDAGSTGTDTAE
ncbi:hypothetical protein KL953_07135 [Mycolicibacterium goodii]|uniref:hypothetical protein n=1 Tax=Mycolicibacterium goodii TaxID=134601 RepID=UPI001BDDB87F|nr:hypothetical protein [Mycolicibacterium goodii]MBU8808667.1 hypothetical protein [Mycolicibacterium goodii]